MAFDSIEKGKNKATTTYILSHQAEFLLHGLEQAAGGIAPYVNASKRD